MRFYDVLRRVRLGETARRPRHLRPLVRWSLGCLAALVTLVIAFALVALHSLDQPWIKRHVQALAHRGAGVDLDYRAIRLSCLSGAQK